MKRVVSHRRNITVSVLICFSVIIILPLVHGCKGLLYKNKKQGSIEYTIEYPPETTKDNIMASMMPSKMMMRFKDDITASELKIGMGIMNASFISNPDKKTLTTLLQIVDKKYALVMDSSQVNEQLNKAHGLKITFSNDTKIIAGFTCKKAIVTDSVNTSVDVFYTKDIKIKNPNWSTPLKEIDGVLMEYQITQNKITMKLTATTVTGDDIDKTTFAIPSDFLVVKKEEMPEIFSQFFQ